MDSGHQTLLNADAFFQEHVAQGRQAIRGAGRIRNYVHAGFIILRVIHAHNQRLEIALTWSRDDDLRSASLDVALCLVGFDEEACGFDYVLNAKILPWKGLWTLSARHYAFGLGAVGAEDIICLLLDNVFHLAMR